MCDDYGNRKLSTRLFLHCLLNNTKAILACLDLLELFGYLILMLYAKKLNWSILITQIAILSIQRNEFASEISCLGKITLHLFYMSSNIYVKFLIKKPITQQKSIIYSKSLHLSEFQFQIIIKSK